MNTSQKSFIEELRSLSEPVKRKVMLGAVAVSMVVVVYLWLAYFNSIVPNAVPAAAPTSVAASAPNTGGPGIFGLFADAAGSFWQAALNGARDALGTLKNSKQYDINPKQ
jgi:hypothetical protein